MGSHLLDVRITPIQGGRDAACVRVGDATASTCRRLADERQTYELPGGTLDTVSIVTQHHQSHGKQLA